MNRIFSQDLYSLHGGSKSLTPEAGMKEDFIVAIVSHIAIRIGETIWKILWGESSNTKSSLKGSSSIGSFGHHSF